MNHVAQTLFSTALALLACGLPLHAAPEPKTPKPKAQKPKAQKPTPASRPVKQLKPKSRPALAPRLRHLAALRKTVVHFSFKRAPVQDVLAALEKASAVPVTLGRAARRALKKRRFKIKYVADRTGLQVLTDICKASALDFVITAKGAQVDTRAAVKKLRKRLKLKDARRAKLKPKDVRRLLKTKLLTLFARDKSPQTLLKFLRKETGIRFVLLSDTKLPTKLTVTTTSTPLGEVLDLALHPVGLDWVQQGTLVLVGGKATIAAQRKAQRAKKKAKQKPKPQSPAGR